MSRDIPIIFSAPMVRALLDGRKTMTRCPAWRLPGKAGRRQRRDPSWPAGMWPSAWQNREPGDRLWVQETVAIESDANLGYQPPHDDGRPTRWPNGSGDGAAWEQAHYRATDPTPELAYDDIDGPSCRWRSAIHMPRWASRLTLVVTAAKIERLQEITREDAIAEGATSHQRCFGFGQLSDGWSMDWRDPYTDHALATPQSAFGNFINRLHGGENWNLKPTNLWDENPEVVALTFTVHKQNIDEFTTTAGRVS